MRSTEHKAPRYVVFSSSILPHSQHSIDNFRIKCCFYRYLTPCSLVHTALSVAPPASSFRAEHIRRRQSPTLETEAVLPSEMFLRSYQTAQHTTRRQPWQPCLMIKQVLTVKFFFETVKTVHLSILYLHHPKKYTSMYPHIVILLCFGALAPSSGCRNCTQPQLKPKSITEQQWTSRYNPAMFDTVHFSVTLVS